MVQPVPLVEEKFSVGDLVVRDIRVRLCRLLSVPVSILRHVRVEGGSPFLHIDSEFTGAIPPLDNPPALEDAPLFYGELPAPEVVVC